MKQQTKSQQEGNMFVCLPVTPDAPKITMSNLLIFSLFLDNNIKKKRTYKNIYEFDIR